MNCSSSCSALFDTSSTVTLTAAADAGSVFTGWSGGGCSGTDTCQVTLDAMTTVAATFAPVYQLSVMPAGSGTGSVTSQPTGVDCGVTCSTSYASGPSVTLTATADPGSRFGGWSGEGCSGTGTCQVTMTAARSVTATFVAVYQLSVAADGSGSGIVTSQPGGINCGATCSAMFDAGTTVTLTASPAAGSRFSGWSGDCSGTGACQVTIGAAASVTATFTRTYALSVSRAGSGAGSVASGPPGIDCGQTCTASFDTGTIVTLTPTPAANSIFAGWSGAGCSGTGLCEVTMTSAANVAGTFSAEYLPDGLLAYGSGSYVGDGTHNTTGAGQSRSQKVSRGHTASFHWRVQNDGAAADALTLKAPGSSTGFTVTYHLGTTNVTKAVQAGSFVRTLSPGAQLTLLVKVAVSPTAKLKSTKSLLLSASSGSISAKDAVLAKVTAVK